LSKKALITQSNYIPWKGYFDAIASVDVFVVFDEMQYTKRDWRNRNMVKTPQGPKWLSIPVEVKGKFFQKINQTKVADINWGKSHWGSIKQNYSDTKYFEEISGFLKPLYMDCSKVFLTEINLSFIIAINKYLNIETEILYSRDFQLVKNKTQRLVDICKELDVNAYYTGSAAKSYMEEERFTKEGISVNYFDYNGYKEYNQKFPPFNHYISILDLLFNEGKNAINYMKKAVC
jgi:hypothetical protein